MTAVTLCLLAVLGLDATTIAAAPGPVASAAGTGEPATLTPPPGLRLLQWSGRTWLVYPNGQPGPEPGVKMTDSPQSVYVDSRGRLHLKIRKIKGVWRSVELRALPEAGYGTYQWVVRGSTAKFSRNTVLGMFVYQSTGRKLSNEIDIEDSRFTQWIKPNNASYTVQPYYSPHHWCTFRTPTSLTTATQQFTWAPGRVTFTTRRGAGAASRPLGLRCRHPGPGNPAARSSHAFTYTGGDVPQPDAQHLYINLWTNKNRPPTGGTRSIVLDSFHFTPLAP